MAVQVVVASDSLERDWVPVVTVASILTAITYLLANPDPKDPPEEQLAQCYNSCWCSKKPCIDMYPELTTVLDEINMHYSRYHDGLERHPNRLANGLTRTRPPRRILRRYPRGLILKAQSRQK